MDPKSDLLRVALQWLGTRGLLGLFLATSTTVLRWLLGFDGTARAARLALCRRLLADAGSDRDDGPDHDDGHDLVANAAAPPSPSSVPVDICPSCGSLALIRSPLPRAPPHPVAGCR